MKTVCKKLFCLMLVAMMLVSAVPFAFAAEGDPNVLWVELWIDGNHVDSGLSIPCTVGETVPASTIRAEAEAYWPDYFASHDFVSAADFTIIDGIIGTAVNLKSRVCEHTEVTVTNTATCDANGVKTTTCKACGAVIKTEDVGATGHSFNGGACTKCGETRNAFKTITFYYLDSNGNETSEVRTVYTSGEEILIPSVPANPNSGFSYWAQFANGTGSSLTASDRALAVNSETPDTFYAIYNKKSAMSELKIYVVRYVNGVRKEANYLYSEHFLTSNDNDMYQYLWDNKDAIRTAAINEIGEGYTWNNKFYNYFTDEELTDANLKDNGNKSVYIKMNTTNANEARVMLYVHKGKTSTVHDILEMDGYNAGEKVYLNDVKDFLKDEGYKWSSISSLYTDEEYDDLIDGENPSGSNHISITDNGTHIIHVILNGASQSNNADSSNPKTGDSIMVAVTTMTLAAAALVAVVELKKRKMI